MDLSPSVAYNTMLSIAPSLRRYRTTYIGAMSDFSIGGYLD